MKLLAVFLLAFPSAILAFSRGAPDCKTPMPRHGNTQPKESPLPYEISVNKTVLVQGKKPRFLVTIAGSEEEPLFRGFRVVSSDPSGNWIVKKKDTNVRKLNKSGIKCVTHGNAEDKGQITLTYVPGTVENPSFKAIVVKKFQEFWNDIEFGV